MPTTALLSSRDFTTGVSMLMPDDSSNDSSMSRETVWVAPAVAVLAKASQAERAGVEGPAREGAGLAPPPLPASTCREVDSGTWWSMIRSQISGRFSHGTNKGQNGTKTIYLLSSTHTLRRRAVIR
jgi:hypothetical protein